MTMLLDPATLPRGVPADTAQGCPGCGGPWAFIHGGHTVPRLCDRCGTGWDPDEVAWVLANGLARLFGART